MGAKGKVTSLVAKKDNLLATRIEEALRKNESLESLTSDSVRWDVVKSRQIDPKGKNPIMRKNRSGAISLKASKVGRRPPAQKPAVTKSGKRLASTQKPAPSPTKGRRVVPHSKPGKYFANDSRGESSKGSRKTDAARSTSKLRVVGFRGRSSSGKKEQTRSS